LDRSSRLLARLTVEARSEDRIDHDVRFRQRRAHLDDLGAELRGRDPAVAAVRAFAADRDDARARVVAGDDFGDGAAGTFHHRGDVVARLRRLHLVRGVERLEPRHSTTATAVASSRECDIERSIAPAPARSAHARTRPDRRTAGFGLPAISTSRHAKARATPNPSAFPTASLAAKRAA